MSSVCLLSELPHYCSSVTVIPFGRGSQWQPVQGQARLYVVAVAI